MRYRVQLGSAAFADVIVEAESAEICTQGSLVFRGGAEGERKICAAFAAGQWRMFGRGEEAWTAGVNRAARPYPRGPDDLRAADKPTTGDAAAAGEALPREALIALGLEVHVLRTGIQAAVAVLQGHAVYPAWGDYAPETYVEVLRVACERALQPKP